MKSIFIPLHPTEKDPKFDPSRLRVLKPTLNSFIKGKTPVEWYTSQGCYINDEGEECELFFELPEQYSFGVNMTYKLDIKEDDKCFDTKTGLQICYPLTGMKTIESPTTDEQYAKSVLNAIWNVTVEALKIECKKSKRDQTVPGPTYNAYNTAKNDDDWEEAVKKLYSYPLSTPKGGGKKTEDRSKPERCYIKLVTKGEGRRLLSITTAYAPGDKKVSALKYLDVRGFITPVVKWDGVYWGAHGSKSYGASARLRITEFNFKPESNGGSQQRMLSPNTAIAVEEYDSDDAEDFIPPTKTSGDQGFTQPGEDDNNPIAALTSNQPKVKNVDPSRTKKRLALIRQKRAARREENSDD
uniref:Uncharacterized protein n=1 Tax=Marseillevirus LCMAC102 TaxID=2506603 RepID=A0A481YTQ9_9VIRU|nr:MAG: protein of unknown function DUF2738 [Marseillevirus LCMAC102]